ncbi:MAG: heme-binding protein [Victivallales bacterium]
MTVNKIGKFLKMSLLAFCLGAFCAGCASYQEIYPRTPSGVIEEKVLPESKVIQAELKGDYFKDKMSDALFTRLHDYTKKRKVEMTIPVEADIGVKVSGMRFYLGTADQERELRDVTDVKILRKDERTVISAGGWGSYSYKNICRTRENLWKWMKSHPEYVKKSEPYVVYWNSPYALPIFKRYEIHIEVNKVKLSEE